LSRRDKIVSAAARSLGSLALKKGSLDWPLHNRAAVVLQECLDLSHIFYNEGVAEIVSDRDRLDRDGRMRPAARPRAGDDGVVFQGAASAGRAIKPSPIASMMAKRAINPRAGAARPRLL
jgi:hypothetical protein